MLQRPADAERAPVEDQAASPVVVVVVAEAEGGRWRGLRHSLKLTRAPRGVIIITADATGNLVFMNSR
jgi:hypothetical protein